MEESLPHTILGHSDNPPSSSSSTQPPLSGVSPAVALQPGETLIVYHPHSQCPMRVVPTTELHGPSEHTIQHKTETPKASFAPFPTRADFEQAEIFVNNNCSNKHINAQLKFARNNGMHLEVKNSRQMHELLARGTEEDLTNDSMKVGRVCSTMEITCYSQDLQFRQEEITVPYVRGEFSEDRTYVVRYRPAMDAVLHVIEDPDLRGVFTMYPERHYVCDPHGGPNMRVWTDVHTADDWWSLQVYPLLLFSCSV